MSRPIATLAGVCGWPIHHSLSPNLHSFWLRELGLSGAYVHFAIRPDDAIHAFKTLKRTSIVGVNVTTPLKELAFQAADEVTPDARKLGVANCLYKRGGKLIAHNTDLEGFAAPLLKHYGAKALAQSPTLVIGTGGASRAVIGALMALGVPEIRLIGRTDEKAEALAHEINVPSLYSLPWAQRNSAVIGAGLIVNASAGGMKGKPGLDIALDRAGPETFIYDLIYTPRETRLLRDAKTRKLRHLGGIEMLIAQARPSFKLFYGSPPPEDPDPAPVLWQALKER